MIEGAVAAVWSELVPQVLEKGLGVIWRRRAKIASEILLDQLSRGDALIQDIADVDEAASMIFEYGFAAQRGAARRNLRLLAQVFAGLLKQSPPLYADEFLRWSSVLADLSREEIILLARLHKHWKENKDQADVTTPVNAAKTDLVGGCKTFSTNEEFDLTAAALIRTGLVILLPGFDGVSFPKTTSRLDALLAIARIDDVLAEDSQ